MKQETVWQLVETSRKESDGSLQSHVNALSLALAGMTNDGIWDFCDTWESILRQVFSYKMLVAFNIVLNGSCSDDRFDDCISSLVFYGQEIFEDIRSNPDNLADLNYEWCEEASIFIDEVWAERNPDEFMVSSDPLPAEFPDEPLTSTDKDQFQKQLAEMYPKLCKKFGLPPRT